MSGIVRGLFVFVLAASLAAAEPQQSKLPDAPVGKAPILFAEDFETTAPGQVPKGYQKQGEIGVADDAANRGFRSLKISPATNGPRRITTDSDVIKALGGSHWGRLFYRVALPAPVCSSGVIHSTIVSARGMSPLHNDKIEFRPVDTILGKEQTHSYIWNVQPQGGRGEFAEGGNSRFKFTDKWTLVEWHVDHATQTWRLFIDGEEDKEASFSKGAGKFEKAEIPAAMESMSFGWWNYQAAGAGFTVWIDDIALSKERIGLRGLPPPPKAKKK
jgi:hypothetical protein